MKNQLKSGFENVYSLNIVFGAIFCDLERFWLHFGRPWGVQKLKKMVKNRSRTCLGRPLDALSLQLSNFKRFLIDFYRFGGRFLARFRVSGRVPGRFVCPNRRPTRSKTLGSRFVSYFLTCEAFRVEGLTSMIRATSSRSMDRWIDG